MSEVSKMKCPNCDRGRVNGGGRWTSCEMCGGTAEVDGVAAAIPPTVETVIASGYTREVAEAIVARERRKADRGEKPYGTNDPLPEVWNANINVDLVPLAQKDVIPGKTLVKSKGGDGTIMTVTADKGDGELACEWKIVDAKGNAGKNSGIFRIGTLNLVSQDGGDSLVAAPVVPPAAKV